MTLNSDDGGVSYHGDGCPCDGCSPGVSALTRKIRDLQTRDDRERAALLAFAMARISALESQVARLTAWSRPPAELRIKCGVGFAAQAHRERHQCSLFDPQIDTSINVSPGHTFECMPCARRFGSFVEYVRHQFEQHSPEESGQ